MAGVEIVDVGALLERAGQRSLGNARGDRIDAYPGAADLGRKTFTRRPIAALAIASPALVMTVPPPLMATAPLAVEIASRVPVSPAAPI